MAQELRSGEYVTFVRQGGIPVTVVRSGGTYVRVTPHGGTLVTNVRYGGIRVYVDNERELPEEVKEDIGY